jgi:hypothetical protein
MSPLSRNEKRWDEHAKCRTKNARLLKTFYSTTDRNVALAKQICSGCPCKKECYDRAVASGEPGGVWGGVRFDSAGPLIDPDVAIPVGSNIYYPVSVSTNIVQNRIETVDEEQTRSLLPKVFESFVEKKD